MRMPGMRWMLFGVLSLCAAGPVLAQGVQATKQGVVQTKGDAVGRRLELADDLLEQTQRVFRLYVQILLDVETERSRLRKAEAVALVSGNIDRLSKEPLAPAQLALLTELDAIWSDMLRQVGSTPSKEGLAALLPKNDKLLATSEKLADSLASDQKGKADVIHLIGRQEMLIQRIARNYFVYHAGYKTPAVKASLQSLLDRFVMVEEQMSEFGSSNPRFKQQIELANVQIIFLKNHVAGLDGAGKVEWEGMSRLATRLREAMHELRQVVEKG